MNATDNSMGSLLFALKERAKELSCLYQIEELFSKSDLTLSDVMEGIIRGIPSGLQYPDVCQARIVYGDSVFQQTIFKETPWILNVDLTVQDESVGSLSVCYTEERPSVDTGPFLKEERKLLSTIADRLERRILHDRLKAVFEGQKTQREQGGQWSVIIDLLKKTDAKLLGRVSRRMINHLLWSGIEEVKTLMERFSPASVTDQEELIQDSNRPLQKRNANDLSAISDEVFVVASRYLSQQEILDSIQKWILEDRSTFLVKVLEDPGSPLAEIVNAIDRFHHLSPQGMELPPSREKGFRVSLVRRLLSDDPHFLNTAKRFVEVNDFYDLMRRIIFPAGSHGRLGGKGSGLFLAKQILEKAAKDNELLRCIKTPRTWYLTSDGILNFINHNDLEEIVEQKYEDIARVRQEYPYIVHVFKNSALPPEIVNGLSVALDDLCDCPLIVRSSSLLEDRLGTSFAGKYKSLFIANRGGKRERLIALMDAIAEVYASTFNPDAIEYRIEHGMIDSNEEMGILIQEVVGKKVGRYFVPAFAGVAFAKNEFRWSQRIRREDALLRMVPGLGTRAVDRVSEDYPILVSPGQPNLRVNVTLDEKVRYSPKKIDLINLDKNSFETIDIRDLLKECGNEYPLLNQVLSVVREDHLAAPSPLGVDFQNESVVVTFDGLIGNTPFIEQIRAMLGTLQRELGTPVDLEFAHDGKDLYLLQCRPQSYAATAQPAVIPRDLPREDVVFSANRYVANGAVSNITHIVYVDPQKYGEIVDRSDLVAIGRAVGMLNQVLPKRQFILMGPGRWGSRGDIKLGVSVTYSDINNTAMLIEIARAHEGYMPDLSFGTHFFQDLVEASIRYLPLYPDDEGVVFNESFLTTSKNILADLLPEFEHLSATLRVIEVPSSTEGRVLQVLMNGEEDKGVAVLVSPSVEEVSVGSKPRGEEVRGKRDDVHWRWRLNSVERLAAQLVPERFGVKAVYLFGSTKNGTAGPQSDIDIIVHFQGSKAQRNDLTTWLEGWSLCLSEVNYLRTGYRIANLLDVYIVTDEDIKNRTSYAIKIGAVTDAPRPLLLAKEVKRHSAKP